MRTFVALSILLLIEFNDSLACSCSPQSQLEEYLDAQAIFVGRVESIDTVDHGWLDLRVRLNISKTWKGTLGSSVDVFTSSQGTACGYPFELGSVYLVYAFRYEDQLGTGSCNRTIDIQYATEELRFITSLSPLPLTIALYQNYPNPFNPTTTISYALANQGIVSLEIFSLLGEKVGTLVNQVQPGGRYEIVWTPYDLPSGVYIYKLRTGPYQVIKKMLLIQ